KHAPADVVWIRYGSASALRQCCLALSLSTPGLGADPPRRPSVSARGAARPRPPPRPPQPCGSPGGSSQARLDHVPSATVVGPSVHEAAPALDVCYAPQSGGQT